MSTDELKQVMDQYNLDENQIAQACCVTPAKVKRWLNGDSTISRSAATDIANYLGNKR